jgi:membrane protease YdiL (CAAX protease family)
LAAGLLGFGALLAFLGLMARLVSLPSSTPITSPPEMPLVTAFLLLAMASVVAGVTEEAAFRGYMQSMIERHYGVTVAILANGTLFGLLHFGNHPSDVLLMLPYYIAVSAVYGGLTWAADSILPALVLHCAGDIVVLTRWWLTWTAGVASRCDATTTRVGQRRRCVIRRGRNCRHRARSADGSGVRLGAQDA